MAKRDCTPNCDSKTYVIYKVVDKIRQDKIKFIAKLHVSVYRTSLQLQIDDYINSTSIKQLGGK